MPRDLFGDVTRPSISIGNRKWYTVPVSLFSHSRSSSRCCGPVAGDAVAAEAVAADDGVIMPIDQSRHRRRGRGRRNCKPVENPNAAPFSVPDGITPEKPVDFDTTFEDAETPGSSVELTTSISVIAPPPLASPARQCRSSQFGSARMSASPQKIRDVAAGVSADRAGRGRAGHRDHRGHDRRRWPS